MFTQEELRETLVARVNSAGHQGPRTPAVAVLGDFTLHTFAQSVLDFTDRLPPGTAHAWLSDFTRTVFLAGQPRNLSRRLPPAHLSADGNIAWYATAHRTEHRELRLLLRAVSGDLPAGLPGSFTVGVPGAPDPTAGRTESRQLRIAVTETSLPRYLVHLGHTLAESLLRGVLTPGTWLTAHHVSSQEALHRDHAYLRVGEDGAGNGRLRAYTSIGPAEPMASLRPAVSTPSDRSAPPVREVPHD